MRADMQLIVIAVVIAFAGGFLAGMETGYRERAARERIAPAPTAVVPDTAQDYIRQYSCFHAITTGDYAAAKECV